MISLAPGLHDASDCADKEASPYSVDILRQLSAEVAHEPPPNALLPVPLQAVEVVLDGVERGVLSDSFDGCLRRLDPDTDALMVEPVGREHVIPRCPAPWLPGLV